MEIQRARNQERGNRALAKHGLKKCSKCGIVKLLDEFYVHNTTIDGRQGWCIKCMRNENADRRSEDRTGEQKRARNRVMGNRVLVKRGLKRCSGCGLVKVLDEFSAGGGSGDKRSKCIVCHRRRYPRKSSSKAQTHEQWCAMAAVSSAIERGDIVRPIRCSVCNVVPVTHSRSRIVFHHTNGYDKEHQFVGVFLCVKCHHAVHAGKLCVEGKKWL